MSKGFIVYRDVLAATWHKIAGIAVIARDLSGAFDRSDRINAGFNAVSPGSSVIEVAIDLHLELALGFGRAGKIMRDSTSPASSADFLTTRIVIVPALIAIAVTLVRLTGELLHWPKPLVNAGVCGKAILGIVWLVPIFSIYFAMKLWRWRQPHRLDLAIALAAGGLLLKLLGTYIMERQGPYLARMSLNFAVTLAGLLLQFLAWPDLAKILLAYGYLSRMPVAIVQFLAMRGAWGTHYDALDPGFPKIGFWPTYLRVALVPNIFFMEAYTVIAGVLIGCVACALLRRALPAQHVPV